MHRRSLRACLWALLAALTGCGLEVVELAGRAEDDATILVLGAIPKHAFDRFATAKSETVEPMQLGLAQPASGAAIPADCAPLSFVWQEPRPKPPKPMKGDEPPAGPEAPKPPGPAEPPMAGAKERYAYELTLRASTSARTLRIYTDQLSLRVPDASWRSLLASTQDGVLTITLRALAIDAPVRVLEALPRELSVRAPWPAGSLYFRRGEDVARARIGDSDPEALALPECAVSDLAVSARGDRLGVSCRGASARQLALPALRELAVHAREGAAELFGSFDPSGTRIARAYAGAIELLDASDGALLFRAPLPPGASAGDASWSHDGTRIALSYAPEAPAMGPESMARSIAVVQVEADAIVGAPAVVVAEAGRDQALRYPLFSPDDRFIVYMRGKARMASLDDATLWLVPASGGSASALWDEPMPREKRDAAPQPTWVVDTAQSWWLVYASRQAVGAKREGEGQQLWATRVDPSAVALQKPLATPPFWLPFQELERSYEDPQWAPATAP